MMDESNVRFTERSVVQTILAVLDEGDYDNQPWAFYEHDHGGLKGHEWSKESAMIERINFAQRVIDRMETSKG